MIKNNDNTLAFVQGILKRFGTIIYTGNREDDIVLMDMELKDLHEYKLILDDDYLKAKGILKREYDKLFKTKND